MAEFNELNGALLLSSSSSSEEAEEEDALAKKPREKQTPLLLLLVGFFFFPREVMPPPAQRRRVWLQVDSIFVGEKSGAKVRRKKKKRDRESFAPPAKKTTTINNASLREPLGFRRLELFRVRNREPRRRRENGFAQSEENRFRFHSVPVAKFQSVLQKSLLLFFF
jgi:hypothetical protein